ncbi:class I SAM-dependent methyltransferase [Phaeobacter gallaeciensis]|uniref:class I SAM-dependent methyltransferase n=1 Tax=Phaeobacter gallaeciensis TaxID=60890 RepID=UPI00237F52A5|nr:class I SAM-dependent methyltransferase [Phaeobacter gallaeciensis]MDE4100140.1 class I SAM-dependent methyltransferase [Phaeobacter gallaeciensis]MDE4108965.1 class I SAM-dependent methyltransferase [Phaeobacter gallaeciensis]MDE4113490.1 class I SAM-dependent methyltransferase [Phaeobacter gallaeciensis]MDE4117952.1 class I SAM-dependent methyltransferase [Phaeobacter gallaeciensis]MDE4122430.1 class I SAM-dependent methyltransferase [Phaeobacter gallaeciensis]
MDLKSEAYQQNYQQFRSLNQIMWQIPVLAMTLTGGLWFGVSRIPENTWLVTALLLTAVVGNGALFAVLFRFRHVMDCYLSWLRQAAPDGFVDASANSTSDSRLERFCNRDKTVRNLFSFMLCWSALCSLALLGAFWYEQTFQQDPMTKNLDAIEFYDQHAAALADSYEAVSFEDAYPFLISTLPTNSLRIIDIGSGSGRDAAWFASKGHSVIAVEPSSSMRALAKAIHENGGIEWIDGQLPELSHPLLSGAEFDIALMSAVWMHIPPEERAPSLARLYELLSDEGAAFITLRIGPSDKDRSMYSVDAAEFEQSAQMAGFSVNSEGEFADILGRPNVRWLAYRLSKGP